MATLKQQLEWMRNNPSPTDPQLKDAVMTMAESLRNGSLDDQAMAEGLDLSAVPGNITFATKVTQPKKEPSFLQKVGQTAVGVGKSIGGTALNIGKALTSSEQKFGTDIGKSSYLATGGSKLIQQINQDNVASGDTLIGLAKKATDPVKKQSLLKMATDDYKASGLASSDILGKLSTNKQIIGEAGGTLVDILGAGSYGKSAGGMQAGQLSKEAPQILKANGVFQGIKQGAKTGAKAGGIFGAAKGTTGAMEEDQSTKAIAEAALGGGITGTLSGGILGGITGGISGGINKAKSKNVLLQESNLTPRQQSLVDNRVKELTKIESSKASIRNYISRTKAKGFNPAQDIASTDLIANAVDNTGTIRTKQPGGAIDEYNAFIKPQENIVNKVLKQEGRVIPMDQVKKALFDAIDNSGIKGSAKNTAINTAKRELAGLALDVDTYGDISLSVIHAAKINKYANINYLNTESGTSDKLVARVLKEIVEDNSSANVKELNAELTRHYANIGYLEMLDGAKVEGGRLGKQFAKVIGGMVGSHFGPLGTFAGAEAAGRVAGKSMSDTFSGITGKELQQSELMKNAMNIFTKKAGK
jgi:hypothetical protein